MKQKIGKVLKLCSSAAFAVIILLAFLLAGMRIFGLQIFTVLSGSMEPEYPTGSVIYVKQVEPQELEIGDVITFKLSENITATHRITEIVSDANDPSGLAFKTKGDANKMADAGAVSASDVIGTPVFKIPYLGYVAVYVQNPPGVYLAISITLILIILTVMSDIIAAEDKKSKKSEEKL